MSIKLFQPVVTGEGLEIEQTPSKPTHAIRKSELDTRCKIITFDLNSATEVLVEKLSDHYMITTVKNGQQVYHDRTDYEVATNSIVVHYLEPQDGTLTVAFFGE